MVHGKQEESLHSQSGADEKNEKFNKKMTLIPFCSTSSHLDNSSVPAEANVSVLASGRISWCHIFYIQRKCYINCGRSSYVSLFFRFSTKKNENMLISLESFIQGIQPFNTTSKTTTSRKLRRKLTKNNMKISTVFFISKVKQVPAPPK